MARATAPLSTPTAALLHHPLGVIAQRLAGFWRTLSHDAAAQYRPERYYMRGPGPAWQAKNGATDGQQPQA